MARPHLADIVLSASLATLSLGVTGCASTPREVVELSYVMGADLDAVQASHEALIRLHFTDLRGRVDDFLVTQWQPAYLRGFIAEGDLIGLATAGDPTAALEGVADWAQVAVEEIQAKRAELVAPLDAQEQELLATVGAAFHRLRTANATITAHLGSLRDVDAARDAELARLGLGDLRGAVTEGLAEASRLVEDGIRAVAEAEGIVDEAARVRAGLGR